MAKQIFIPKLLVKKIFMEFDGIENERYGDKYVFKREKYECNVTQEPKHMNRFIVEFPERFNITSYLIQSVSPVKFSKGKWCDVTIEMLDVIGNPSNVGLLNIVNEFRVHQNNDEVLFPVILRMLDPVGVDIQTYRFDVKDFGIEFSELTYNDNKEIVKHKFIITSYNLFII